MKYAIPVLLLLFCGGCFFKSDKTGTADNIIQEFLYTDRSGQVLIAHEKIFHATSKSSGGGITHISGYTHTRISAYDVRDGRLLARRVMGDEQGNPCALLTISGNKLWYVSGKNKRFTLATMDPRTLNDVPLPAALLQQAPFVDGHLFRTDWFQLKTYCLYDATRGIVLHDEQGIRYTLDPAALKVEKLNDPDYQPFFVKTPDVLALTAAYNDTVTFQLSGNPRSYIHTSPGWKTLENDPGYLKGRMLADISLARICKRQPGMQNQTGAYYMPGTTASLLAPIPGNFFILHASSGASDAQLQLSYLQWTPGHPLQQHWQTTLQDLFYDAGSARETNAFKTVFSSGNPEFGFKWADYTQQQQLLLTWMLHTVCIDLKTGKVLWKMRH